MFGSDASPYAESIERGVRSGPVLVSLEEVPLTIQLVLADPHPALLSGLAHVFSREPDLHVRACVNDGEAALWAVREFRPDVLVLDLALPVKDGLAVVHEMQADGLQTRPVLFTAAPAGRIVEAVRLGVPGVVTKDMPIEQLVQCIREVSTGRQWLDKTAAENAVAHLLKQEESRRTWESKLTPRERAVARLLAEGLPNKRIATQLDISVGTTKMHLHSIYRKLRLRGRLELMRYMQQNGV